MEEFWNGGKQLTIEILYGEVVSFGKERGARLIRVVYVSLNDETLWKALENEGFEVVFTEFIKEL